MGEFSDNFTALVCPQCGGQVKITKEQREASFLKDGNVFIYVRPKSNEKIVCDQCKTEFVRDAEFKAGRADRDINTGGGAYIGGNVVIAGGGDFVGGNKTTFIEGDFAGSFGAIPGSACGNNNIGKSKTRIIIEED